MVRPSRKTPYTLRFHHLGFVLLLNGNQGGEVDALVSRIPLSGHNCISLTVIQMQKKTSPGAAADVYDASCPPSVRTIWFAQKKSKKSSEGLSCICSRPITAPVVRKKVRRLQKPRDHELVHTQLKARQECVLVQKQ